MDALDWMDAFSQAVDQILRCRQELAMTPPLFELPDGWDEHLADCMALEAHGLL